MTKHKLAPLAYDKPVKPTVELPIATLRRGDPATADGA
jgi:hypothetical protein